MQQLLQNSQFGAHSLGRPPQLPLDRAARSPFDVALGKPFRSISQTAAACMLKPDTASRRGQQLFMKTSKGLTFPDGQGCPYAMSQLCAGQSHRSLQTASSGSAQHSMLRMGGGLPLGGEGSFRSMERSLGSECSPATSYGNLEGSDDLDGVTQANVERNQQMYVRYAGISEGEAFNL